MTLDKLTFKQYKEIREQLNSLNESELSEIHLLVKNHLERRELELNEGFIGKIWKWLKLNFSPTASNIKDYAQEYETALEEELSSEAYNTKLRNDILNGNANSKVVMTHISRAKSDAIRGKMRAAAHKDQDYLDLVDSLITEIDYRVSSKKFDQVLKDPEVAKAPEVVSAVEDAKEEAKKEERKAAKEVDDITSRLSENEKQVATAIHKIVKAKFSEVVKEHGIKKKDFEDITAHIVKRGFYICNNLNDQSKEVKESVAGQLAEACATFFLHTKDTYEEAEDVDIIDTIKHCLEFNTQRLYVSNLKEKFLAILEKTYKHTIKEIETYEGYDTLLREQKKLVDGLNDNELAKFKKLNSTEFSTEPKIHYELEYEFIILGLIKGDKLPSELTVSKIKSIVSHLSAENAKVIDLIEYSDQKEYDLIKASYAVLKDPELNTEEDYRDDLMKKLNIE
jgi:hypothetical protein